MGLSVMDKVCCFAAVLVAGTVSCLGCAYYIYCPFAELGRVVRIFAVLCDYDGLR
jgi:hypothetical protein